MGKKRNPATREEKAEIIAVAEEVRTISARIVHMTPEEKRQAKKDLWTADKMIRKFRREHPDD